MPLSWCRAFGAVSSASLKFAGGNTQSPPAPPHAKRSRFGFGLPSFRCRAFGAEESASLKFLGGNTQSPPRPAPCETKRVRIRVPVSWCRAFGAVSSASLKFAGGNTQSPPAPPHAGPCPKSRVVRRADAAQILIIQAFCAKRRIAKNPVSGSWERGHRRRRIRWQRL